MPANSEASAPGTLTLHTVIHDVVLNYSACIRKDESRKTNNTSHDEQVPSIAAKSNGENEVVQQPTVRIPDMFVCFCSLPPIVNKYYDSIKRDSDTFIRIVSGFNERQSDIHIRGDFPYFGAILYVFSNSISPPLNHILTLEEHLGGAERTPRYTPSDRQD